MLIENDKDILFLLEPYFEIVLPFFKKIFPNSTINIFKEKLSKYHQLNIPP